MSYRLPALLLILFMLVVVPPATAQPYRLYIGACGNCTDQALTAYNDGRRMASLLPFARELSEATYSLQDVRVSGDENAPGVTLIAEFHARTKQFPISAHSSCTAASNLHAKVMSAFDELLVRSLFDPGKGPYAELKIKGCQVFPENPDYVILTPDWEEGGIGIDGRLFYELAVLNDGAPSPSRIEVYVSFDGSNPQPGQPLEARVSSARPFKCPRKPLTLVRHILQASQQGSQYANYPKP